MAIFVGFEENTIPRYKFYRPLDRDFVEVGTTRLLEVPTRLELRPRGKVTRLSHVFANMTSTKTRTIRPTTLLEVLMLMRRSSSYNVTSVNSTATMIPRHVRMAMLRLR